jgi:hypothetical protein
MGGPIGENPEIIENNKKKHQNLRRRKNKRDFFNKKITTKTLV